MIESISILYAQRTALLKTADVFNDQNLLLKFIFFYYNEICNGALSLFWGIAINKDDM